MKIENELIVLKFGTTSVCDNKTLVIKEKWIQTVAEEVKKLIEQGNKVVIFTSGGLATGKKIAEKNFLNKKLLKNKNLIGALGLGKLLYKWQENFDVMGVQTATLTIRNEDLDTTSVCNIIIEMVKNKIVPIINENIPLQSNFNNDELAANVCKRIAASKFVLFTDTNGIYSDNPKINPNAKHIKELNIENINIGLSEDNNSLGSGGMHAKLNSAIKVYNQGIKTIIANGTNLYPLSNLKNRDKFTVLKKGL